MTAVGQSSTREPSLEGQVFARFRTIQYPPALLESGGPTSGQGRRSQSEFNLLGDAKSIVDLDTEVADGALQLGMPEQQLDRS
jgi:hypothetical protein